MERLHMCSWLREKSNSGVHFVSQEDFQDKTWGYCGDGKCTPHSTTEPGATKHTDCFVPS